MTEIQYVISQSKRQEIADHLSGQPYGQVFQLVELLKALPVFKPVAVEDEGKLDNPELPKPHSIDKAPKSAGEKK